jgi:hypothetical protein
VSELAGRAVSGRSGSKVTSAPGWLGLHCTYYYVCGQPVGFRPLWFFKTSDISTAAAGHSSKQEGAGADGGNWAATSSCAAGWWLDTPAAVDGAFVSAGHWKNVADLVGARTERQPADITADADVGR